MKLQWLQVLQAIWLVTSCFSSIAVVPLVDAVSSSTGQSTDSHTAEALASSANHGTHWKRQAPVRGYYCILPAQFPANVVSAGGVSGCVPGMRLPGNTQCLVKCKQGTLPVSGTSRPASVSLPAPGSYTYVCSRLY
jgi:hypothetical protein